MIDFSRLACDELGLVHPDNEAEYKEVLLELGTFIPIESDAVVDRCINEYLRAVKARAAELKSEYFEEHKAISEMPYSNLKTARETEHRTYFKALSNELREKVVLGYDDFIHLHGRGDTEQRNVLIGEELSASAVRTYARLVYADAQARHSFKKSRAGYRQYLRIVAPALHKRLSPTIRTFMKDKPRHEHTYIVATTGTGKSELIKALVSQYDGVYARRSLATLLDKTEYNVVLIDPGGDMSKQIACWEVGLVKDLIYIDPFLYNDALPIINPFDGDHLSDKKRIKLTEHITAAIGAIIEGKAGGTLSINMERVLRPSIRLMIDTPDATMRDLQRLMKGNEAMLALGRASPVPSVAEFFNEEFDFSTLDTSKLSIATKLGNILDTGVIETILCGRTTVNIDNVINRPYSTLLFNLASGRLSEAAANALGTLIIALVQASAMSRVDIPKEKRIRTHLIIDECQNFATGKLKYIIREGRKFGLSVTLAQQEIGGEMSADLMDVVKKTTNVKVIGGTASGESGAGAKFVEVETAEVDALKTGEFFYKVRSGKPFKLRVRSDLIDFRGYSKEAWDVGYKERWPNYYSAPAIEQKADQSSGDAAGSTGYIFE